MYVDHSTLFLALIPTLSITSGQINSASIKPVSDDCSWPGRYTTASGLGQMTILSFPPGWVLLISCGQILLNSLSPEHNSIEVFPFIIGSPTLFTVIHLVVLSQNDKYRFIILSVGQLFLITVLYLLSRGRYQFYAQMDVSLFVNCIGKIVDQLQFVLVNFIAKQHSCDFICRFKAQLCFQVIKTLSGCFGFNIFYQCFLIIFLEFLLNFSQVFLTLLDFLCYVKLLLKLKQKFNWRFFGFWQKHCQSFVSGKIICRWEWLRKSYNFVNRKVHVKEIWIEEEFIGLLCISRSFMVQS